VLRALQRRFSAANLRVQIAECENRLTELVEFERGWRDLVGQVRPLMQACDHDDWPPKDPLSRPRILQADALRLDLRSRLATVFRPYAADPLGKFLNTSLQVPDPRLYQLFGVVVSGAAPGLTDHVISAAKFEAVVAESESIIAEHRRDQQAQIRLQTGMLEEGQRLAEEAAQSVKEERAYELDKVRAGVTPTFRTWVEQKREAWPWKVIWPFVEKPLLNALWPLLVAGGIALWHWLRTLL